MVFEEEWIKTLFQKLSKRKQDDAIVQNMLGLPY